MTDETDPHPSGEVPPETKLTRTKRQWAQSGKFLTGKITRPDSDRLPPGQHLVKDWPVLDLGLQPQIPTHMWRFDVTGAVESPISWDWNTFLSHATSHQVTDIHCVTTWSRYDNRWDGLLVRDLLDMVMPKEGGSHVMLHSFDGYTTNLALEDFAAEDAMLVHSWEGKPLTVEHGGPMRLVLPHLYFWKSAKWLQRVEFRTFDKRGFWEMNGYHNHADPWKEERYSDDE